MAPQQTGALPKRTEMTDFANITGNIIGIDASGEVTPTITIQSSVSEGISVSGNVTTGGKGNPGDDGIGVPVGGTTGQYLVKSSGTDFDTAWDTITKTDVGLANVDNTSDVSKPIST